MRFECKMLTEQNAPDSLYFYACIVLINSAFINYYTDDTYEILLLKISSGFTF